MNQSKGVCSRLHMQHDGKFLAHVRRPSKVEVSDRDRTNTVWETDVRRIKATRQEQFAHMVQRCIMKVLVHRCTNAE